MADRLRRFADRLCGFLRLVSGVLLIASVVVNAVNIVGRYVFAQSLPWAEETMLFLMVGFVFLGSGLVGWSGRHIRMDVFLAMLPAGARRGLELATDLVLIAASILLVVFAWPVLAMLWDFDQRSQAANFPLVIPQAMVPLGLALTAFLVAVRRITGGGSSGADPSGTPGR